MRPPRQQRAANTHGSSFRVHAGASASMFHCVTDSQDGSKQHRKPAGDEQWTINGVNGGGLVLGCQCVCSPTVGSGTVCPFSAAQTTLWPRKLTPAYTVLPSADDACSWGHVPGRMRAEAAASEMAAIGGAPAHSIFPPKPSPNHPPNAARRYRATAASAPSSSDATSRVLLESSTEKARKEPRPAQKEKKETDHLRGA
ncbi:hypothetical protein CCMA1212_007143 [Trichoderma ghanense]|uniref:Uncharacterized protein n=1 Tax=Trichoderma ghanense TaxID=65468 RepID=A0ABY2H0B7_9HYPO